MVARVLLLVCLGGCDGVLHLERIPDQRDAPPPTDGGPSGDGAGDGSKVGACVPPVFTKINAFGGQNVMAQGIAQNMDLGFVISAGEAIDYTSPALAGVPMATTIGGNAYAYLAVQPNLGMGAYLFFYNATTGKVFETMNQGTLTSWTGAITSMGLPGGAGPGAPAELPAGELRMMVAVGAELDEYDRKKGADWQLVPNTAVTEPDLGATTAILSYPALTPDGLGLVFDVANDPSPALPDGIYFMVRDTLDAKFSAPVRIYDHVYTSPVLSKNCSALYAVNDSMQVVLLGP